MMQRAAQELFDLLYLQVTKVCGSTIVPMFSWLSDDIAPPPLSSLFLHTVKSKNFIFVEGRQNQTDRLVHCGVDALTSVDTLRPPPAVAAVVNVSFS